MNITTEYMRIGELTLKVISGVTSFAEGGGYDYAEHAIISGAKTLQAMGRQLKELSMTVQMNGYIHDDITATLEELAAMRDSGEAQRVLFGDGIYAGSFVITSMQSNVSKTYSDGSLSNVNVDITLIEAVTRDVVDKRHAERADAKTRRQQIGQPSPQSVAPDAVEESDQLHSSLLQPSLDGDLKI